MNMSNSGRSLDGDMGLPIAGLLNPPIPEAADVEDEEKSVSISRQTRVLHKRHISSGTWSCERDLDVSCS